MKKVLFLIGKIFLALVLCLLLIGMIGLDRLSKHPLVIGTDSPLRQYIPQDLHFDQAILKTDGFYNFPTLELTQLHFQNKAVVIKAPSVHCTWRFLDILLGKLQPMAMRIEKPVIHIFPLDTADSEGFTPSAIIKTTLDKIPLKYLEIQEGKLTLERQDKNPLHLEKFTLFIFKHLTKTIGALEGNVLIEGRSVPVAVDVSVNHFNLEVEGTIKVNNFNLNLISNSNETMESIKKFYPYDIDGTFSFDLEPAAEKLSLSGKWSFYLEKNLIVPIEAQGKWNHKNKAFSFNLNLPSLEASLLSKIWYPSVPKVRNWILENIPHGHIKNLSVQLEGTFPSEQEINVTTLKGFLSLENGKLIYKADLPPLEHLNCTANFDLNHVKVDVAKAHIKNLEISHSSALLKDFSKEFLVLELNLNLEKSLESLIWLLNHPPLRGVLDNLIPKAKGGVNGNIFVNLPLKEQISSADVRTKGDIYLSDAQLDIKIPDKPLLNLSNSSLHVQWTEKGLEIKGTTTLDNFKTQVDIQQNFSSQQKIKSNYNIKGTGNVKAALKFLPPDIASNIKSTGKIDVDYKGHETFDGIAYTDLKVDFKEADLALLPLKWHKKAGIKGEVDLSYTSHQNLLKQINKIVIRSKNLDIEGKVNFDNQGHMDSFLLSPFKFNNSQGVLKGTRTEKGWKINSQFPYLHGESLVPVIKNYLKNSSASTASYDINFGVKNLFLAQGYQVDDFKYASKVENGSTKSLAVSARNLLKVSYGPQGKNLKLFVSVEELGPLLQGLQLIDTIKGKKLIIEAERPIANANKPFKGTLFIDKLYIKDAPVFAQLLSLISLEGLLSQLKGKGLVFKDNEAQFQYKDQKIAIEKAKIMSSSIGITAKGYIDLKEKTLSLEGVLVPANFLNQIIGNVPILGHILTGGKGEGVFSISYSATGPLNNPKIRSNPLGLLAPNFLKNLFQDITHSGTPTPTLEEGKQA